jgi:pilus assembly protein CpaB
MNVTRVIVLGVAALAAGGAALIVRTMVGGETAPVSASVPPPAITTDVLVASTTVPPGRPLEVGSVRWEAWPKTAVSDAFITKDEQSDMAKAVAGMIVRSPLVAGQPITPLNTVRSDVTGFLAATLMPGMRAVAMPVEANTGAGGFLLPNDRVDILLTHDVSGGETGDKVWRSDTILEDVRLLAIDQTATPESATPAAPAGGGAAAAPDTQSKVGKVATLELTPRQAEILHRARAVGSLYLSLRSLGDSDGRASVSTTAFGGRAGGPTHLIIRYGIARDTDKKSGS